MKVACFDLTRISNDIPSTYYKVGQSLAGIDVLAFLGVRTEYVHILCLPLVDYHFSSYVYDASSSIVICRNFTSVIDTIEVIDNFGTVPCCILRVPKSTICIYDLKDKASIKHLLREVSNDSHVLLFGKAEAGFEWFPGYDLVHTTNNDIYCNYNIFCDNYPPISIGGKTIECRGWFAKL